MVPAHRHSRSRLGRSNPQFDRLETRSLLSILIQSGVADLNAAGLTVPTGTTVQVAPTPLGQSLTVVAIDPAPGRVLTTAPTTLTLTFDRPIDPFSLDQDIMIQQVADPGSTTPTSVPIVPSQGTVDSTGTKLTVTLDQPLAPGHYQVFFTATAAASLAGTDGSSLGDISQPLADFRYDPTAVTLDSAIDLGTPGSTPSVTSGSLDFQANPQAVQMYRFTLTDGNLWRTGIEVTAQRDGGTLDSALTLFDSQGHPIATAEVGRKDAVFDPYLFAGLKPGTYYIGISGKDNLPGLPGGYDPSTGSGGSVVQTQPGGTFRLHLVADAVTRPTSVLRFRLDQADSLDPSPSGFTLQFSGAIQFAGMNNPNGGQAQSLSQDVEVVDQNGKVWTATGSGYDETTSRVSFLFQSALPAGHYIVRLPSQGGLTDLAGLAPVASGKPSGVLATFDVRARTTTQNPNDLGVLRLDDAYRGIKHDGIIAPGAEINYRFVVEYAGQYVFQSYGHEGPVVVSLTDASGKVANPTAIPGWSNAVLAPGIYALHVVNLGTIPVHSWTTITLSTTADQTILNGIGQGAALDLRLIVPTPLSDPTPTPTPTPVATTTPTPLPIPTVPTGLASVRPTPVDPTGQATPDPMAIHPEAPAVPANSGAPAATRNGSTTPSGPAGLFLTLGGDLAGRPSAQAGHVAAVGPGAEAETPTLALNQGGLSTSIPYGFSPSHDSESPTSARPGSSRGRRTTPTTDGSMTATVEAEAADPAQAQLARIDENWLESFQAAITAWVESSGETEPAPALTQEAALRAETAEVPQESQTEQTAKFVRASLASPIGLGLTALLAIRYGNRLRVGRRGGKPVNSRKSAPTRPMGEPHRPA